MCDIPVLDSLLLHGYDIPNLNERTKEQEKKRKIQHWRDNKKLVVLLMIFPYGKDFDVCRSIMLESSWMCNWALSKIGESSYLDLEV